MAENTAVDANVRQVGIQRIFLKDASYEAPNTPGVFNAEWKPHINLNINTNSTKLDDGHHEVILTVTAEVKNNDENAFLCEVQQAGVFLFQGLNDEELRTVIGSFCPNQLYPYARAAITDLVAKGGFPGLTLQPLNFDALLAQHAAELQKAQNEAGQSEGRH